MQSANIIFTLALGSVLFGCGHHDAGSQDSHGGGGTYVENEPNDDAAHADYLGEIRAGDFVAVEGHITQYGHDEFDGFAFYALEPVSVHITLHEGSAFADLDFAIYIPEIDEVVDSWETDNHPEYGVFHLAGAGEFHIVVDSWIGDSSYLLEVDVRPLSLAMENGPGISPTATERFSGYSKREFDAEGIVLFAEEAALGPVQQAQETD
ncbi:MAG: hypothetical protein ACI9F9_002254 [Candidatus Paceibacteria bacterium]|jgi:hypothetical protein